jgi:hypothetical protein
MNFPKTTQFSQSLFSRLRLPAVAAVLCAMLIFTRSANAQSGPVNKARGTSEKAAVDKADDPNALGMELAAAQLIFQLDLSPVELRALSRMLAQSHARNRARQAAKVTPNVRKAMTDLRDAMIKGDPKQIGELSEKMEKLFESDKPELDDLCDITEAARQKAPELLKLLGPRQVLNFLQACDPESSDPLARLTEVLKQAKGMDAATWKNVRDESAADIGWMIAGFDTDKGQKVIADVTALLDRAHQAPDKEQDKYKAELEKLMHKLMEDCGPTELLRHVLEHQLAELLSNPRAQAMVEARLAAMKK